MEEVVEIMQQKQAKLLSRVLYHPDGDTQFVIGLDLLHLILKVHAERSQLSLETAPYHVMESQPNIGLFTSKNRLYFTGGVIVHLMSRMVDYQLFTAAYDGSCTFAPSENLKVISCTQ